MQSGHCSAPKTTMPVGPRRVAVPAAVPDFLLLDPHAASTSARAAVTTAMRTKRVAPVLHEDLPVSTVRWNRMLQTDDDDPRDEVNIRPTSPFCLVIRMVQTLTYRTRNRCVAVVSQRTISRAREETARGRTTVHPKESVEPHRQEDAREREHERDHHGQAVEVLLDDRRSGHGPAAAPPNMSESPPPRPACSRMNTIRTIEARGAAR